MNKQLRWIFSFLALLALASLACNALAGGDNTTNPAVGAPGAATEDDSSDAGQGGDSGAANAGGDSAAAGEQSQGPQSLDLEGLTASLEDVNSYRLSVELFFESQNATDEVEPVVMRLLTAVVVDPPASQTEIEVEGGDMDLGEMGSFQFIQVGETTYTMIPGLGCVSGSLAEFGADANPFADLVDSDDLIGDVRGARRVLPDEVINGVDSYHFVFDETAILGSVNELEELDGHLYVAKDGGYLVRMVFDGTGTFDMFSSGLDEGGRIHIEINVSDVNQPVEIRPPEDCASFNFEIPDLGGLPGNAPYPVVGSAHDLFVFEETMSYQTEEPFVNVVDFYQVEMPLAGFTPAADGTVTTDTAAVLNFDKDGGRYIVTISESNGTVVVQVILE